MAPSFFLPHGSIAAGANKGRHFFVCPRARDEQCDFFAWAVRRPRMGKNQVMGFGGVTWLVDVEFFFFGQAMVISYG